MTWQEKVILFLQLVTGGIEPKAARREAESLKNSPDLNETWIAEIVAQASSLLSESPPSPGRSFSIVVYGNSPDEIEMNALNEARNFFGQDARLEVIRNYVIGTTTSDYAARGVLYMTRVLVKEIVEP